MPIELKQVLEAIEFQGNADEATIEQISEHIGKTYIGREVAHTDEDVVRAATGKRFGAFHAAQRQQFKSLGVEFAEGETKGKSEEEVFQLGMQRLNEKITSLKESASKGNDKKLEEMMGKYSELEKKFGETNGLLENANKTIEQKDSEYNGKVKSFILNNKLAAIKNSIPLSKDTSDAFTYQVKGWNADLSETYEFDLEGDDLENAELIVKEKKTGKRVTNGSKFETVENILTTTAAKAGILAKNTGKGTPEPGRQQQQQQSPTNNGSTGNSNGAANGIPYKPGPVGAALANVDRMKEAAGK